MRKHKRSHSENRNERTCPHENKERRYQQYLPSGRPGSRGKGDPFRSSAHPGHVCGKYRSDTHRSRSQRPEQRPEREAHPKRDDYRRHRYTGPAVPSVAHRLRTADRHGHQLYLCLCLLLYRARLRLQRDHGRSHRRRLNRRFSGTFRQILDKDHRSYCRGQRRHRHRLLPALRGRGILRRRQRQRDVRLPSEPDPRNRDIAVLHPVQHLCEVLLEAALRPFRTDRRLYFGYFYGDG